MSALLEARGVSKAFAGVRAVDDASLTVESGSITRVGSEVHFVIQQEKNRLKVAYHGSDPLPDTFEALLSLTSFGSPDSLLETLQATGLPPTLVELDLSESAIDSPTWFLANKAMFHGIKRLVLRDVSMDADAAKALATLGPEIVHTAGGGAKYRYVVGSE